MNSVDTPTRFVTAGPFTASFTALTGVPLVKPGDDLAVITLEALSASDEMLRDGDILVIAQKIVSKAQGRIVQLASVEPSPQALTLACEVNKDPRLVELILRESTEVVRYRRDVLVVAHRLGFVMANAGIDQSNIEHGAKDDMALLLPENPDASCAQLREALKAATGADVAVIINDSHGRAFRNGTVGVAIGASGLTTLADLRGKPDLFHRRLQSTEVGVADEIASAASLFMGQAGEGRPIVLARGLPVPRGDGTAAELVRAKELDLFRIQPAASPPPSPFEQVASRLLRDRRSVRRYSPQPVPDIVIEELIYAATCAPSAHNRQPWRFALLKDTVARRQLAYAMGEQLRADRTRDGDPLKVIANDVARSTARITGAPLGVVVCLTMEDMDAYPDERRMAAEHQMAVQGAAMAMQNMLLAAHAAGLGASVMCAPLFCPDTVRCALELPPQWEPQALVTLGYPAAEGKPFRRRPLPDVVRIVEAKP
jgi:coenzyme F420-0:L-glutamate ligase/coenzyme F420-1:gamma-L-glutamate ligase